MEQPPGLWRASPMGLCVDGLSSLMRESYNRTRHQSLNPGSRQDAWLHTL